MKHITWAILVIMTLISCGNRNTELFAVESEIRVDDPRVFDSTLTYGISIKDIKNTFEVSAAQKGYTFEDISSINPSIARLENVFGDNNYGNLSRVRVYITDKDETVKREIFYQEIIKLNHVGPLQLFGSLSDVKSILENETYNINVELNFRSSTVGFLENRLIYSFVAIGNE